MSPHPPSDEVLHGHGHHHHDHMPVSPSAPELREFEDSEFTYTEGDTSSTNSSSYSTSDDEDRPNVGQDEEEDFFHDAEDYSVASGSSSSSGLSMGDLIRELELEEDEEMFLQRRLAPELEELAAKELNEDPVKKAAMLREFRSWVRNNPSIKRCRLDSNFLLRFLRMKKYNFEAAKECLMKYFKFRQQHPFWAADLDVENPTLLELTSKGFVFVLPERDDQGRRVIFNIAQKLDPSRHTSSDMAKMFILAIETLLEDEENQIRGIVYVSDCRDLALQNIMIWTPADIQKILTRGEKAYPMRHKMIHFMNLPLCAWFAYELLRGCLSHKLRSRLMGHSDDVKLSSQVPKRILPKEYGGTIPVQEMAQTWIQELKTHRKKVLALDDMEYHVPEEPHHEKSGWGLRKYLNKAWMSAWHKAEKTVAHAAVDS